MSSLLDSVVAKHAYAWGKDLQLMRLGRQAATHDTEFHLAPDVALCFGRQPRPASNLRCPLRATYRTSPAEHQMSALVLTAPRAASPLAGPIAAVRNAPHLD